MKDGHIIVAGILWAVVSLIFGQAVLYWLWLQGEPVMAVVFVVPVAYFSVLWPVYWVRHKRPLWFNPPQDKQYRS